MSIKIPDKEIESHYRQTIEEFYSLENFDTEIIVRQPDNVPEEYKSLPSSARYIHNDNDRSILIEIDPFDDKPYRDHTSSSNNESSINSLSSSLPINYEAWIRDHIGEDPYSELGKIFDFEPSEKGLTRSQGLFKGLKEFYQSDPSMLDLFLYKLKNAIGIKNRNTVLQDIVYCHSFLPYLEGEAIHEASHALFDEEFNLRKRNKKISFDSNSFDEAYEELVEETKNQLVFPIDEGEVDSFDESLAKLRKFNERKYNLVKSHEGEEVAKEIRDLEILKGVDEHLAQLMQRKYLDQDVSNYSQEDIYDQITLFTYTVQNRRNIISADIEAIASQVEQNSYQEILSLSAEELVNKFSQNDR